MKFFINICIYLGLSNPSIEAAINTGLTTFLDTITKTRRPYERTLDPHGRGLALHGAKGNFRVGMHNAVERELATTAKMCGLDAMRQGPEVFGGAIPVGPARERYRSGGNRGGLVPDLTIRAFPAVDGALPCTRVYEVKAFGHND
jgi:hypothetical protein